MDLKAVSQDLDARAASGKQWLESGVGLVFPGPALRKFPTSIELVEFLDSPKRAERFGLGFEVSVQAPEQLISFQINIRIKPHMTDGPKLDSHPYVVSYVVDQIYRTEALICFDRIIDPKNYDSAMLLTVQEWYLRWLELALDRGGGKFFQPEARKQL